MRPKKFGYPESRRPAVNGTPNHISLKTLLSNSAAHLGRPRYVAVSVGVPYHTYIASSRNLMLFYSNY